jgi:hypothetical protein
MNTLIQITAAATLALAAGTAAAQYYQYELASPDDEGALSIDQTMDGGFVTAGWRKVPDPTGIFNYDFYVTKHDKNGNMQWLRVWGGPEDDIAYSVQQTRDGGYIIAGESQSFEQGFELVLLRLDALGSQMWAKSYPHLVSGDLIHGPHPGVSLDLTEPEEEIIVTGNIGPNPTLLYTDPQGLPFWHNQYVIPPVPDFEGPPIHAFTDVAFDHNERTAVVSGSIRYQLLQDPTPASRDDAILMKVDQGGFPFWYFHYDWPFDRDTPDNPNVAEYGHGVDVAPDGFIYSAGRTDFGRTNIDDGVIMITTDPGGVPFVSMRYQPLETDGRFVRGYPGYASIEFDQRFWTPVVVGTIFDIDTFAPNAFMMLTDPMLMPFWVNAYGDTPASGPVWPTWGESVAIADLTCGWGMAGRAEHQAPPPFLGAGDNYLVKTEDNGVSGCLERPINMAPEMPGIERPLPVEPLPLQGFIELPNLLRTPIGQDWRHCHYPTCYTGPCNPADLAQLWGVLDLADVSAFVTGFLNQQPIADLNNDGILDLADVGLFVTNFTAGCP